MAKNSGGMSWVKSFFVIGLPLIIIAIILGRVFGQAAGH